jgi:hypothetical protein
MDLKKFTPVESIVAVMSERPQCCFRDGPYRARGKKYPNGKKRGTLRRISGSS